MKHLVTILAAALLAGTARAQAPAPLPAPKPTFVPGLYESESRNSRFQNEGAKSTTCLPAADYDAFRRDTIAEYLKTPQFTKACRLSDTKAIADGFAFAMDCGGARTIVTYQFAKNFVSSTTETLIVSRPEYSSTILTLSRRIGDCPAGPKPGKDL